MRDLTRRVIFSIVALMVTVLAAVVWAPTASAHSALIGSDPADGAPLAAGPAAVTLTFNEPVQKNYAVLKVVGPDEHYWQDGEPTVTGRTVTVPVRELGPTGTYLINYRITSADGHPVEGQLDFELTVAGSGTPGPAVDAADSESSGIPVWPFIVGGVVVFGAGLAFALRPQRKK